MIEENLHAGSLCGEYLVLYSYGSIKKYIVRVPDNDIKWNVYCTDVTVTKNPSRNLCDLKYGYTVLKNIKCVPCSANPGNSVWLQIQHETIMDEIAEDICKVLSEFEKRGE